MRWHPQVKHAEVALKLQRVQPPLAQCRFQRFSPMQSLAAGRNLHPPKQQVKALRGSFSTPWCGIEGTAGEREADDEHRRHPCLLFDEPTQLSLRFWIKVVSQVRPPIALLQPLKARAKFPNRHAEHAGQRL